LATKKAGPSSPQSGDVFANLLFATKDEIASRPEREQRETEAFERRQKAEDDRKQRQIEKDDEARRKQQLWRQEQQQARKATEARMEGPATYTPPAQLARGLQWDVTQDPPRIYVVDRIDGRAYFLDSALPLAGNEPNPLDASHGAFVYYRDFRKRDIKRQLLPWQRRKMGIGPRRF
jgi:hypothetical protein